MSLSARKAVPVFCAVLALWLFPKPVFAAQVLDLDNTRLVQHGIRSFLAGHYKFGEQIFLNYIREHPDEPTGYFLMAGRYAETITLRHDWSLMPKFEKYARLTTAKARRYIQLHPKKPLGYFFLGSIYGFYGLLNGQRQEVLQAFTSARSTVQYLKKSIELEPELYDSYYGLGTVYYYASKMHVERGGLAGWFVQKFITDGKDMRREGLAMIRKAANGGGLTSDFAWGILLWISLNERRYSKALKIATIMAENYPADKRPYWVLGRIHLQLRQCRKAKGYFDTIIGLVNKEKLPVKHFPEVANALTMADICLNINRWSVPRTKREIRQLRRAVKKDRMVWLEYSNAADVRQDWRDMLNGFTKCLTRRKSDSAYVCRFSEGAEMRVSSLAGW